MASKVPCGGKVAAHPLVVAGRSRSLDGLTKPDEGAKEAVSSVPLSVVIFGATGDLAKKKLYPALYQLMFGCPDAPLLPKGTQVVGLGRSAVELAAFLEKQCVNVKGEHRE